MQTRTVPQAPRQERQPRPHSAGKLLIFGAVWFSTLAGQASGCDANLLTLLQAGFPQDRRSRAAFELAWQTTRLMEAMQTLGTARSALATTLETWKRNRDAFIVAPPEGTAGAAGGPAAGELLPELDANLAQLQERIGREDLLTAHETVQALFFLSLRSLHASPLPESERSLLEFALALQDLQESARRKDPTRMAAALQEMAQGIQGFRSTASPVGSEAFQHVETLIIRLPELLPRYPQEEEKILMAVAMLKSEFATLVRNLAGKLAPVPARN